MRGTSSFDGKLTGNRQMVDRYNEAKGKSKKPNVGTLKAAKPAPTGGESGGVHEAGGHDEIKQVVAEHGPATSHHVMRSPQGYHTLTHHEDGYVHHADHASLEDAHTHAAHAHDDTGHLGDMGKEDYEVEREKEHEEAEPSSGTSKVGFMT